MEVSFTILNFLHTEIPLWNYIVFSLYGTLFIWKKGATPGKMIFKLKVVTTYYRPIGFWSALFRESIGKWISSLIFNLGYLWVLIDKKNQAWHDKMAHTFVVKLTENKNLIPGTNETLITLKRKITFWILLLVNPNSFAFFFLVIYIFLFRAFQINGNAMNPTYQNGQYYITSLRYGNLDRGNVVILIAPDNPNKDYIKRIIGLPGDKVMIKDGFVYINDQLLNENQYLSSSIKTLPGNFIKEAQPIIIPPQNYFMLGDNRNYSADSRVWGFVPKTNIIGKLLFCYWNCSSQER
ncbi:MAG TPA: signal peptidase I [Candidatus Saccharimonadales bacterium]|nr:signal peptidase I [Candidatus Saccharimonadales bacterium]